MSFSVLLFILLIYKFTMALNRSLVRLSNIRSRVLLQEGSLFCASRVLCANSTTNLQHLTFTTRKSNPWSVYRQIHDDKSKTDSKTPLGESGKEKQGMEGEKEEETNLTQVQRLKKVFAEYGSTAVVFHVCISLTSLGICYCAVKSGLDVPALLQKLSLSQGIADSVVTQGASTFVIAYACHKVFAPARMFMTITCTPLIVRKLRMMGILKAPIKPAP